MIFSPKRIHSLPEFPPDVIPTFRKLCNEIPVEEISEIRSELIELFKERAHPGTSYKYFDFRLAGAIEEQCLFLLDNYADFPSSSRKLIMGAVNYCAVKDDSFSEENFATGLDDDAKVLNYVLEEIGLLDRAIKI